MPAAADPAPVEHLEQALRSRGQGGDRSGAGMTLKELAKWTDAFKPHAALEHYVFKPEPRTALGRTPRSIFPPLPRMGNVISASYFGDVFVEDPADGSIGGSTARIPRRQDRSEPGRVPAPPRQRTSGDAEDAADGAADRGQPPAAEGMPTVSRFLAPKAAM